VSKRGGNVENILGSCPVRDRVEGSPYQPGDVVCVVAAVDREVCDLSEYIGCRGVVEHLEYQCGCGQSYPADPMIGVRFGDGDLVEFWREELGRSEELAEVARSREKSGGLDLRVVAVECVG
jgi:hypothetical protein